MTYRFESVYFDNPIVDGRVLDVFMPDTVERGTALFFVHGGGWFGGARANFHSIMRAFNAAGFICGATDYRLGGVIQDQITDVRHGYKLFIEHLRRVGRPLRVVVFGSSAGAHLAALLALAKPGECGESATFRDVTLSPEWVAPVGAALQATPVLFEPWEDIFPHVWVTMQRIVGTPYGKAPELYRRIAPMTYVRADSCPVFFLEAEDEHMFPSRYCEQFVERMRAAGCRAEIKVYTHAEHGFVYDVTRRQQREAFADMLAFIDSL